MVTLINKILGLTWLGDVADTINGNKTMIGLIALVVHLLNIVPTYFPEFGFGPQLANGIQEALKYMGVLLPWGAVHKVTKAMEAKNTK